MGAARDKVKIQLEEEEERRQESRELKLIRYRKNMEKKKLELRQTREKKKKLDKILSGWEPATLPFTMLSKWKKVRVDEDESVLDD